MGRQSNRRKLFLSAAKYARNFRSNCACHSQSLLHDIQTPFHFAPAEALWYQTRSSIIFHFLSTIFFSLLCASLLFFFQFCVFFFNSQFFLFLLAQTSFFALIWFERVARMPRINAKRNDCTQTKLISFARSLVFFSRARSQESRGRRHSLV